MCQKKIYDYINLNISKQQLLFISGAGGTGKSFFIDFLDKYLSMEGLIVEKLATTGQAAKLIKGTTIHSFFKINGNN